MRCPCGRHPDYDRCCGRLHRSETEAATAEQLMRSRYSAYALGDATYLLRTWHPSTRPAAVTFDPDLVWEGLEVLATSAGGLLDAEGTVTFAAHHRQGARVGVLREVSRFVRQELRWFYVGPSNTSSRG